MYTVEAEDGEVLCPKCDGHMCIENEDGAIGTCSKCWGKGKLDWVTNAMTSPNFPSLSASNISVGKISASQLPSDISFFTNGSEILKICGNGDFVVKGKKVASDKKVYEGFVDFLKETGYYI
jgi:hypothetical protein